MRAKTVDVIVVGSGIAGLASALSARQEGASVTLLERAGPEEAGGNTRYTEAFLRMKSLDEVADDLVGMLTGDFMGYPEPSVALETLDERSGQVGLGSTLNIVRHDVVETLVQEAGPTLRWLNGFGVKFDELPTPFPTTSTTRLSPVGGGLALVEALSAACESLGVEVRYRTTARRLMCSRGAVSGVEAVCDEEGISLEGAVVLACGGYEGNPEMVARYHGERGMFTRPVARGGYYNKGEGIEMALAAGATTSGNFGLFHAEPIDPRSGQPEAAIFSFPYGILVNSEGCRFIDEAPGPVDAWYERITRQIHRQTRGIAYWIMDAKAEELGLLRVGIRTDQSPVTASTIGELAGALGLPADSLENTVVSFNAACGSQDQFDPSRTDGLGTVGLEPRKSNWARPISESPFLAYPIIAANVFTFGGLRTDQCARVLDQDGRPIRALYAAGEMTGLYYTNYTGSTSVLRSAVFGRIAGRHAAVANRGTSGVKP